MKHILPLLLVMLSISASAQKNNDTVAAVSSPVLRSYVPPEIVARAVKKYGRALYCIEKTKAGGTCEDSYLVGLIRNGRLTMEWLCEDLKIALLKKQSLQSTKKAA